MVRGGLAGVRHSVFVFVFDFILARRGEATGDRIDQLLAFDCDGATAFGANAPERDIIVMGAPVGERAG